MESKDFATRVRLASSGIPKTSVETAIKIFEKLGHQEQWDVNNCVMAAGEIPPNGGVAQPLPPLFADSLSSLELAKAILPWMENVRMELFGSANAPFESYQDAINWLESEENVSTPHVSEEQRKELIQKTHEVMAEIAEKVAQLPRSLSRAFYLSSRTFFIPYIKAGNHKIIPASTEKLRRLHDETEEMEKATGFDQRQLVAFVLADLQPRLPVVRVTMPLPGAPTISMAYNLPTGGSILRCVAQLECLSPRELKLEHLKRFYNELRKHFQIVKKKTLTNEDRQLLSLIGRYGPAPTRGQLTYWRKIAKEYNRKVKRQVSWNALRMRWYRLDDKKASLKLFKKATPNRKKTSRAPGRGKRELL